MMAETLARSLSATELADRLRDHDDFAVRTLAMHVIDGETDETEMEERLDALSSELSEVTDAKESLETQKEDMVELLEECTQELGDAAGELITRIQAVLRAVR